MKIAYYKYPAKAAWYKVLHHQLVCWWTHGRYSHVEVIFGRNPNGTYMCASASARDSGVRFKDINLVSEKWDIVDIRADQAQALAWFNGQAGKRYDYLAWLGFLFREVTGSKDRWFCSEAVAAAIGFSDPWRFDPNTLYTVLTRTQP